MHSTTSLFLSGGGGGGGGGVGGGVGVCGGQPEKSLNNDCVTKL